MGARIRTVFVFIRFEANLKMPGCVLFAFWGLYLILHLSPVRLRPVPATVTTF